MIFDAAVEAWRDRVDELKYSDMPTDALLAWIAEESGGLPCAVGIVRGNFNVEAGIGQQYFETVASDVGGVKSADLRAACGTDPRNQRALRPLTDDEQIAQVSALVTDAKQSLDTGNAQLAAIGADWTPPERWCLAKLQHALPAISAWLLRPGALVVAADASYDQRQDLSVLHDALEEDPHRADDTVAQLRAKAVGGSVAKSWRTWFAWVLSLSETTLQHMAPPVARFYPLHKFAVNAERVGCAVGPIP